MRQERVVWEPGTQTFIVLNCLHESYTNEAEKQVVMIEQRLAETSDIVTVRRTSVGVDIEAV